MDSLVDKYVEEVKQSIDELARQDLSSIADTLFEAYRARRRVFILGNGGSAATSAHLAAHLRIGLVQGGEGGLLAESLMDNVPTITAVANDFSYERSPQS